MLSSWAAPPSRVVRWRAHRGSVNAQGGNDDIEALNLALLVEYTEAAFYDQALAAGALKGEVRKFAEQVAAQETEHLAFLKKALGDKAEPEPKFDLGDRVGSQEQFAAAAAELEDLAVAAYNGQATNISKETLAAAAKIVSVEARHAAWIRSIVGRAAGSGRNGHPTVRGSGARRPGRAGLRGDGGMSNFSFQRLDTDGALGEAADAAGRDLPRRLSGGDGWVAPRRCWRSGPSAAAARARRHGDPELRADAGVPAGRVLHGGGAHARALQGRAGAAAARSSERSSGRT